MNLTRSSILLCLLVAGSASASTITTLSVDFESPTFHVGDIGGNPPYSAGQGGWFGFGYNSITNIVAHSGSQSLSTSSAGSLGKSLDPSLGELPSGGFFEVGFGTDWWAQGWVNIRSGGTGAVMSLGNGLGSCPLIQISGTGVPYLNSCTRQDANEPSFGAGVFDQWLLFSISHTVAMGQGINFGITNGGNIDFHRSLDQYTGPGTGNEQFIALSGEAYWDDISAGYGPIPVQVQLPVPEPGSVLLFGSGLALMRLRRKRGILAR
ncbi:MAG: PEP-CTERM sorting domain-containing protein [Steroidobacteraceae bacterium]